MQRWKIGWRMMALGCGLALAGAAQAQRVELKIATLAPEGSDWMEALTAARAEIQEATEGRVRLRLYPSGIMGEERDVLFKIRAGQLDGAGLMGVGLIRIVPDSQVMMVPLLFRDYDEVDATLARMHDHLEAQSRSNGFTAMAWTEVGFAHFFSTVPVRNVADLRGARPWATSEEGMLGAFFSAARVNALPVPVTDVLTALQTGLLRTVYAPPLGAVALQWHTRVRYVNDLRLSYQYGGLFIAERAWNRLSPADRETVRGIVERRVKDLNRIVRERNREAMEVIAEQGVEVISSSPEARAEFEAVRERSEATIVGRDFSREAWDRVQGILRELRDDAGPDS